jgi:DNA (cytosine-5)-methyltransferase 1
MHKNRFYILGNRPSLDSMRESSEAYRCSSSSPSSKKLIKFISLFSGAMGLDLGLEAAGFHVTGCLELDKKACATIQKNRPSLPLICDDIRNWTGDKLLKAFNVRREEIAFIAGGPPCPSFSTAGKRRAFEDPRGQVMFDYLRIISEIRPPFFVMENVRGILSAALTHVPLSQRKGKANSKRGTVLRLLEETFKKMGYTVSVELVNAANYGTPQKRERVIFLGSRDGFQLTMPTPYYQENENLFCPKWRTLGDAVCGLNDPHPEFVPFSKNRQRFLKLLKEGENWRSLPVELQAEALGGAFTSSGGRVGFFRRLRFDEPSPTVPTSPVQKSTCLCHPVELRPLSVKEYARVQQFPDDWVFEGSITDKYRQIGNAVPVGLGFAIGNALKRFLLNYEELERIEICS